jgi:4-aminobutyrate aminotransferase
MDRERAEPSVETVPGTRAEAWVERTHRHAAPSTRVYEFVWDPSQPAAGPYCTDVDGNVLLDFTAHVGAMPLGYNNPILTDKLAEFDLVDPAKIAGQDFYVGYGDSEDPTLPGPTDLMDKLTDCCTHYGLDTVFLSNSGAEAVENAIKVCYDHTEGRYAVTFEGAFHGRTLGALSLNRSKAKYRRHFPQVAGVHDAPYCADRTCTAESCGCGFFRADESALWTMLDPDHGFVDPAEVAYVVLEPIQGEGGFRVPSDAFMREVATVVERLDVPLVVDEVQSGLGRTGELWAADHYPIEPDVITAGKGLRVGATVASSDLFPSEEGRLSSTWGGGDLLASAAGAFTIDAIHEHDLLATATDQGRAFRERLRAADLPGLVDVRGKGLMVGVEWQSTGRRDDVLRAAFERGLLTLGGGDRTLRVLPPLDVRQRELEQAVACLEDAAQAVA